MQRAAERVRGFLVSLLALAFLLGSSAAATHLHFLIAGGEPAVSANQHQDEPSDAICPICLGLQIAGHFLPPDPPRVDPPASLVGKADAAFAAAAIAAPVLAFRSRAPPRV